MSFWHQILAIIWKDVLSEMRTKEIISSVLVFTLLVIIIFNFSFSTDYNTVAMVAPGILWVTFAFAGVLSLNRSFVLEKEEGCIEGLMVCPVSREAIFVGKMLSSLLFMLVIEAIALPVFVLLFNLPVLSPQLIIITAMATIGFAAVGTLFSAIAVNTRAREMVLPILFFPVVAPIIISAAKASGLAISGETWGGLSPWIQIILAFDVIYLVVSYLVFNFVVEE